MAGAAIVLGSLLGVVALVYAMWAFLAYREGRREAGHEVWMPPEWLKRISPINWMDYWEERGSRE